jgi:hypothetical protein
MLSRFPRNTQNHCGTTLDLEYELGAMLENRAIVLTAKLRYTNPALVPGTTCETARSVEVVLPSSCSSPNSTPNIGCAGCAIDKDATTVAQKYKIHYYASNYSPTLASQRIAAIRQTLGNTKAVIDYADTVMEELKYRARVETKLGLELDDPPFSPARSASRASTQTGLSEVSIDSNRPTGSQLSARKSRIPLRKVSKDDVGVWWRKSVQGVRDCGGQYVEV